MGKKESQRSRENRESEGKAAGTAVALEGAGNGEREYASRIPLDDPAESKTFNVRTKSSSIEEEKGDVFKIIADLEGQLESTFAMKEALEGDLEVSRKEVGDLRWTKKDLEARVNVLEQESAAATDLQSELSFAEEEKSRALEYSQDLETKLKAVTEERDSLKTEASELQVSFRDAEKARGDLESQVYRLSEKVRSLEEVQSDLVQIRTERDKGVDRIRDLESEVESTKTANKALDLALKHAEQAVTELRADKKRLEKAEVELKDEKRAGKARLARVEEENESSLARIAVLENEIATLLGRNQALEAEMDTARKTLGDIHTALADTKAKARKRYYRVKKS